MNIPVQISHYTVLSRSIEQVPDSAVLKPALLCPHSSFQHCPQAQGVMSRAEDQSSSAFEGAYAL